MKALSKAGRAEKSTYMATPQAFFQSEIKTRQAMYIYQWMAFMYPLLPYKRKSIIHILCVRVCMYSLFSSTPSVCAISYVASPALPYFSTLPHKQHDFWEELFNIQCVL